MSNSSASVQQVLSSILADQRLSLSDWYATLEPAINRLPRRATAETQLLLELLVRDDITIDYTAAAHLRRALRDRFGYDLTIESAKLSHAEMTEVLSRSVTAVDKTFSHLSQRTGRTDTRVTLGVLDVGLGTENLVVSPKLRTNWREDPTNGKDDDWNFLADDVHGFNFKDRRGSLADADPNNTTHGTWVTAVAARGTTRIDVVGARVGGMYEPIKYAVERGAKIINMSLGIWDPRSVRDALALMKRYPDVLFVLAAGNEESILGAGTHEPKRQLAAHSLPNLIVVAAADRRGALWSGSNRSVEYATVGALGVEVVSAQGRDDYGSATGTSLATPHVTNLAAKVMLLAPTLTPADVKRLLVVTVNKDTRWTSAVAAGGTINAERSMKLAALIGLVHAGVAPEAAADRVDLKGAERTMLLSRASEFPRVAVPTPRLTERMMNALLDLRDFVSAGVEYAVEQLVPARTPELARTQARR